MAPNEQGVGLPLWCMLCSCDDGEKHEQIALEITLKFIFEWLKDVRPSALVIMQYIMLCPMIHVVGMC